jgi:hypothetical protein
LTDVEANEIVRPMRPLTPWQVGFVTTILRALARGDRAAMKVWTAPPGWPARLFSDGVGRIVRITQTAWCHEGLAPWRSDDHPGPRRFMMRADPTTTLARFAERESEVLVLVIVRPPNGDAKLADVRVMARDDFERFGDVV